MLRSRDTKKKRLDDRDKCQFLFVDSTNVTMSLNFLTRIEPGQSEKFKLNSINFKGSVQHLKDGISKKIKRNANDFGE